MIYLDATLRRGLSSENEAQSRCPFDASPISVPCLPFIILIVITADNASNERRVGSLQADAPEIDRAFHRRSGR